MKRPLSADARSESLLVEDATGAPFVLRVVRAAALGDASAFRAKCEALKQLRSESLLPVVGVGTAVDGRSYVVVPWLERPSLATSKPLPIDQLASTGIECARGLQALHAAGLTAGPVTAAEVFPGAPAVLDVSLAGLSRHTPVDDVRALAQVLLAAGAAGADRGTFESVARQTVEAATTAEGLAQALEALQTRWRAHTAVRGPGSGDGATIIDPDLVGTQLGPWVLERLVGEGAMGRVYVGKHQRIGRTAAVKVLKDEHARSAELVQRFIQEAQAVNAIRNEHIVEIYDFGEEPQPEGPVRVYCVMELLEGRSLADAFNEGPMRLARAARITQQLAQALDAAHRVGVVHRDIKPENVFLHRKNGVDDFVKVLDFGVAKLLKPIGDLPRSGTQAGVVIGTPEYMAPEQALGTQTDLRVDVYAVGLVLYELISGVQPFQGDTFGKLVVQITTQQPPPLPALSVSGEPVPPGLVELIDRCLAKDPQDRLQSAEALARALDPFTTGAQVPVVPVPTEEESLAALKPSFWPTLLIAAAALVVVGAGGYFAWRAQPESDGSPPPSAVVDPPEAKTPEVKAPEVKAPVLVWLAVSSAPPGARVTRLDTGQALGVTPFKVELSPKDALALRLELDGHQTERRDLALSGNVSLSVDLKALPKADVGAKKPPVKKGPVSKDGTVDPFSR